MKIVNNYSFKLLKILDELEDPQISTINLCEDLTKHTDDNYYGPEDTNLMKSISSLLFQTETIILYIN